MHELTESPPGSAPAPDWTALADSSLVAFLRMLADDPTPDAVAASLAHGPLGMFRPTLVCLGFVDSAREVLTIEGLHGADPHVRNAYASIPLSTDMPATVCYRTNTVVTAPAARMAQDFPLTATYAETRHHPQADNWAFPIRYRSAVIAILGLELTGPASEPWLVRSAVATLAGPLATWAALRIHAEQETQDYWSRRSPRTLTITDRQKRIIALVGEGLTNAQIAEKIGYSVPTVKAELARLCALLGAADRADLTGKASRAGL
jgi:DNA-binding CsgD family transcriptional regulator